MKTISAEFLEAAVAIRARLIRWRRRFHAHPELGLGCHATAQVVTAELNKLGLAVESGLAETGVLGLLQGAAAGPVLAMRVDMDALPIRERTPISFRSQIDGCMHACGHDGHTAIGLGVATVLAGMADRLPGQVKFIFQPGEEHPGGAKIMIAQGVLEQPAVDAIVGCHIHPSLPSGHIGICGGTVTAGCTEIAITIHGVGGHAARPHECKDPIIAAGHLIVAIQTITSRLIDPLEPVVVTIGQINGGSSHNIIPEQVSLKGTLRYLSTAGKEAIIAGLKKILPGIETAFGVSISLELLAEEPPMRVSDELSSLAAKVAEEMFSPREVSRLTTPSMGAEDFARFAEQVPAAYFRLGCHDPDQGHVHDLHTPEFDFDEEILANGTAFAASLIWNLLTTPCAQR